MADDTTNPMGPVQKADGTSAVELIMKQHSVIQRDASGSTRRSRN